jgi:hypothetical protein
LIKVRLNSQQNNPIYFINQIWLITYFAMLIFNYVKIC